MAIAWCRIASMAAIFATFAACGPAATSTPQTDVGITDDTILLGSTNAQSGTASAYINNQGGINGRRITLKVLNDGYDPAQTVQLTKQLVEQDKVFALFDALGTKAQLAVRDYLNTQKVPQMFVSTGATTWGLDYSQHNYSLGWQPPYQGEARILPGVVVRTTTTDHFPIMQEQAMTWNGTGWTLQGSIINKRGTLK